MNKQIQNLSQPQIMSGVAVFSTLALGAYSIKNILEINKKLEDIHEDMEKIKHFITDNQRKNNIVSSNLGKKLEEVQVKFLNAVQQRVKTAPRVVHEVHEVDIDEYEETNEIDNAIQKFMKQ